MNKYWAIVSNSYKRKLEHRANILFANLQSVFTLFILFYFWQAIYSGREVLNGYTFTQIITYYFLMRVTYNRVSTFGASDLANSIKSGDITKDLVKPVDYINLFISRNYIGALFWTVGNLIAILLFSFFLYATLMLPTSILNGGMFLVFFLINGVMSNLINILIGTLGFWSTEVTHLKLVSTQLISLLSGGLIPLAFFPQSIQNVLNYLPFKYLVEFPINVYLGKVATSDMLPNLVILWCWVTVLYVVSKVLFQKGLRDYESFN